MSDHEEETGMDTGYDTPVPELDDHRNRLPTTQRTERPRRGTFDSLYGQHMEHGTRLSSDHQAGVRVRDFEEAVDDGDAPEDLHEAIGSRRLTSGTVRTESPPNSVKAFAEARRRERDMSFSEQKPEKDDNVEPPHLQRVASVASRRSLRSRAHTVDNDASSMASTNSAEEDVCFPVSDEHRRDQLRIDYAYLESFMQEEREEREEARRDLEARTFPDLRPQISATDSMNPPPMVTSDGDFVGATAGSTIEYEKEQAAIKAEHQLPAKPVQHVDPNRFSFFSSAWESTIHAADFSDLVLPGESVRGLFTFPEGESDGVWWLNVNSPTEDEARAICRAFGIHPLTSEDITQQETREKIEIFPSYYFASFRSFNIVKDEDGEIEYEPFHTYVVVFREGTLSFSFAPNTHASKVRTRIALLKDYVALSSDWICYALIDDIVDSFAPTIHETEMQTERLEDEVFVARTDDMHDFLRKIGNTRKNVMGLMRLLGGKADVLRGFTKRCNENYNVTPRMDIGMYLGDIQDHVVTMMNNLMHCEKMLSRTHSNYLAQLSIDSISQGTNTNRVLSKITFIASIIVPLNVVTGLFGMNVAVPFNKVENLHAFTTIVVSLVGFCIVSLVVARRMRYI
ncbi:Mg2+ transporter protein [Grosmannia clavigera kw1407]|uniref:Mg2+ transporter protein n=1 Tax=Grosmannia clavigera (strain kw1407 / UAMH 11150) TaxID=655863 RepID=F0XPQ1_GROCL|nr:Mg2+ transporter protein [Grosmannia clavigera kw1407]EFX00473.1 Mg2+ transporter protein [Grosmannia clavigera kw1407]